MDSERPVYDDGSTPVFSEAESTFTAWVATIFASIGTVSNLLTIFALINSKRLRWHPTTMFLVSLSLSDLIFSAYNLPLTARRFFHRGCEFMCLSAEACKYFPFFFFGNLGASVYTMALIAVHRVFGVFMGKYLNDFFNAKTVPVMIVLIWLLVFSMLLLPLTETMGQFGFEPRTYSCTIVKSDDKSFMEILSWFGILFPCALITVSYITIFCKVKFTGRSTMRAARDGHHLLQVNHSNDFRKHIRDRERDLTKTLICIFFGFVACFLPFSVLTLFDPMPPSKKTKLHLIAYYVCWASSFINPIIYCVTNKYYYEAYREALSRLFFFTKKRKSARETETTRLSNRKSARRTENTQLFDKKSGKIKDIGEADRLVGEMAEHSLPEIIETTRL